MASTSAEGVLKVPAVTTRTGVDHLAVRVIREAAEDLKPIIANFHVIRFPEGFRIDPLRGSIRATQTGILDLQGGWQAGRPRLNYPVFLPEDWPE